MKMFDLQWLFLKQSWKNWTQWKKNCFIAIVFFILSFIITPYQYWNYIEILAIIFVSWIFVDWLLKK